jgi:hypothetical protein
VRTAPARLPPSPLPVSQTPGGVTLREVGVLSASRAALASPEEWADGAGGLGTGKVVARLVVRAAFKTRAEVRARACSSQRHSMLRRRGGGGELQGGGTVHVHFTLTLSLPFPLDAHVHVHPLTPPPVSMCRWKPNFSWAS